MKKKRLGDLAASGLDRSHAPFKVRRKIGPGPRKRAPITKAGDWECEKAKATKTHYVQVCVWQGDGIRKPKRVKIKKSWKRGYNKLYRAWAKKHTGKVRTTALPGYKCRSTRTTKC
jgi:hypothetical protein